MSFQFWRGTFQTFLFQVDIQGVSLKGKTNPNKTTNQPPLLPQDFTFPGDGTDLKDGINKKGQLQNLILIRSKADGTGNVVQHSHITHSQEQRGLIQNRRQDVRYIISAHHKAPTPTSSVSLFHWTPVTPLPGWENSQCAVCDGDFVTSLLLSATNRSHAAPRRAQMLSKIHPHTRLVLFPPRKAQPLFRAELAKHPSHPLAGSPCAQLIPDHETNLVWELSPPVPRPWGRQLHFC